MTKREVMARVRLGTYIVHPDRVAEAMIRRGLLTWAGYSHETSNRDVAKDRASLARGRATHEANLRAWARAKETVRRLRVYAN